MTIPKMPMAPILDTRPGVPHGTLHPNWGNFFDQMITHLQQNIGQEGIVTPPVTNADLTTLNSAKSMSNIVYNTDISAAMLNNTGAYSPITTSAGGVGVATQLTVGASGAASPTPASPDAYENININGTQYARPLYKVS
jgi:hypothetical protein